MRFCAPFLACLMGAGTLLGGPTTEVRREFKQSQTFPYIFRPVGYLVSAGPTPMRFSALPPECGQRTPPPAPATTPAPPVAAEEELTKTEEIPPAENPSTPAVAPTPAEEAAPPEPALEPAAGANAPSPDTARSVMPPSSADFNRMPDEVLDYFRNPYDAPEGQYRYEDPIFRPARPEELPKSNATLTQNQ